MQDQATGQTILLSDLFANVIVRVLGQKLIAELSSNQISLAQVSALRYIWRHNNVLMGDLAEGLSITYPSATNMVKRLEKRGLVQRQLNPADRREVEVRLTPDGAAMVVRMEEERRERLAQALAHMTPEDRDALTRGLYAFLKAALREFGDISADICLRCGTQASDDCPVCAERRARGTAPHAE